MIEDLFAIEKQAYRQSIVHRLDARVKIVSTLAVILATVALPYSPLVFPVCAVFIAALLVLWAATSIPFPFYLKRLAAILPFGIFLIFFQIFFKNRFYTEFHAIATLPLGITIFAESAEFALILFAKFIVCVSFIILLASTTRMQEMLEGANRLGLPAEFTLVIGLMVRYVFVIGYMFRKVQHALENRSFDPLDRRLPYRYRLRQVGYIIGTIFLRSYEQGERTYVSMLCRGYGRQAHMFVKRKPLSGFDILYLSVFLAFVAFVPLLLCTNLLR